MNRHEHVQDLLTGHALDELSLAERQEVDAHLAECDICANDARELALAFDQVGSSETPVAPPPELRAKVLRRLSSEQRSVPRRNMGRIWLALAATLVLGLAGGLFVTLQRQAQLREQLRTTMAERATLADQIATTGAQADRVVAILTAPDMRRSDLQGVDASTNSVARAYWSVTQGLLIVADRLPAPPPGRAYQVWLIGASGGPVSAGLIEGPRSGRGILIAPSPLGVPAGPVTVAVTDEPAGGLSSPTGSKHLIGSI
jgi:anti-sigma-K factor RskA